MLLSRFLPSGINGYLPEEIRLGVLLTLHDDNPNGVAGNILSKREIAMLLCNKLGINDGFGEWCSIDMATADSNILENDKIVPEVGGTSLVGIITGVRDKLTFGDGGWFSPFLPPRSVSMQEVTSPFPDGHQATRQSKYATNDAGLAWLGLEEPFSKKNAIIMDVCCAVVKSEEDVWPPPVKASSVGVAVVFDKVRPSFIPILRYKASK